MHRMTSGITDLERMRDELITYLEVCHAVIFICLELINALPAPYPHSFEYWHYPRLAFVGWFGDFPPRVHVHAGVKGQNGLSYGMTEERNVLTKRGKRGRH